MRVVAVRRVSQPSPNLPTSPPPFASSTQPSTDFTPHLNTCSTPQHPPTTSTRLTPHTPQAGSASLFAAHPREAAELFATSAPDNAVKLWDVRAPSRCVRAFAGERRLRAFVEGVWGFVEGVWGFVEGVWGFEGLRGGYMCPSPMEEMGEALGKEGQREPDSGVRGERGQGARGERHEARGKGPTHEAGNKLGCGWRARAARVGCRTYVCPRRAQPSTFPLLLLRYTSLYQSL